MTLASGAGLLGVALYVGSYAAVQFGLLRGQTFTYAGLNLFASSFVLFSLTENYNQSSALIQIMWIVISLVGITRLLIVERTLQFSDDERQILDAIAPGLPKDQGRKLLNIGEWRALPPGAPVIEEGQPTGILGYLVAGSLVVSKSDMPIISLGPGTVIGEMTYLDGSPATARIVVMDEARLFAIDSAKLRALVARHEDIANAVERSVARTLRGKLQATSQELRDATSGFMPSL
jgi:CRP-like cAMP-binding protein